jgi:hypothetical protein
MLMRNCDLTAISDKLSLACFPKERKSSHLPENPWHSTLRHSYCCCCKSSAIYKENHKCHRLCQLSDSFEIQKRKTVFSFIKVLAMKNPVQVPLKNSMFLSLSLCRRRRHWFDILSGGGAKRIANLMDCKLCDMKEEV